MHNIRYSVLLKKEHNRVFMKKVIGFVGGYFLSVDPAKDFYGDWYGAANEGNESFLLE